MKKLICLLLAFLMAVTAFGCAESTPEDSIKSDETTASDKTDATSAGETDRADVSDGLPDNIDYDGREFRTLVQDIYKSDIWVEKPDTGEIVNDAVYARNLAVSERLGINIIESSAGDYSQLSQLMKTSFKSSTYDYDVCMQHLIQAGNDALNGYFVNWYNVPNIDFTREWYPSFAIDGLTVNGKMLIAVGDMLLATIDRTYCIFYDKDVAISHGIEDIDDLSLNHEWTIDKMIQYVTKSNVYSDNNHNSTSDVGDYFGFGNDCINAYSVYYYCFDLDRLTIDEDYNVVLNYNGHDGKIITAIEKLKELMLNESTYCWTSTAQTEPMDLFMDQNLLFVGGIVGEALSTVRQYDHDYGIIPYPMFDTNQENYYTIMGGGISTMEIINTVPTDSDYEFIGTVVEAMCSETWRSVIPQYYDVALKYKGTRDQKSVDILEMIVNSRAIDVAIAYDGWQGLTYKLKDFVNGTKSWSSSYKSLEKSTSKQYSKIAKIYENLD